MYKRIFALLLAFCLLMGAVPGNAFAVDTTVDYAANKGKLATFDLTYSSFPIVKDPTSITANQVFGSDIQVFASDIPADLKVKIDDYYVNETEGIYWYKIVAADGYTLPEAFPEEPWVFQNYVGSVDGDSLIIDQSTPDVTDPSDPEPSDPDVTDPSDPEPSDPEPTDPSDPEPSDPSDPVDPETPEISATVKDANGNVITDSNGNPLKVTVSGDALPEGATLSVNAVANEAAIKAEIGMEGGFFWDIKVFDADGNAWQPATDQSVTLSLPVIEAPEGSYVDINHYPETTEGVKAVLEDSSTLIGSTDDFSAEIAKMLSPAVAAWQNVVDSTSNSFAVDRIQGLKVSNGLVSFSTSSFSVYSWDNGFVWTRYSNADTSNQIIVCKGNNDTSNGKTFYAPNGQSMIFDTGMWGTAERNWNISTDKGTAQSFSDKDGDQAWLTLSGAALGATITVNFNGNLSNYKGTVYIVVVEERTVNFNGNGGTPTATSAMAITDGGSHNQNVTLPNATRTGYTFLGWYTAASGGTRVGGNGTSYMPTSNGMTLYAQWSYNVTYNLNGGTGTSTTQTLNANNNATLHGAPSRSGYHFLGWYSSADSAIYGAGATYSKKAPTTMTALWGKTDGNGSWNHKFYVLPGTSTFSDHLRVIDGATKANSSTTIARPDIVADSNIYYVAPGSTLTFERSSGSWRIDGAETGITASVGTSWAAADTITVTVSGSAAVGTVMMLYSRSTTGTTVNCARIEVRTQEDITTMAINDTQNIYRVGVYILTDSTKIPGEPNYTTGVSMINVNGGMNYSATANGVVSTGIAGSANYIPSLDGSCTMGVVDYTGRGTIPYMDETALDAAMERVITALAAGTAMTAADGVDLTALYNEKGADYIRTNYAVRPHIIKLMTGLSYNELGWHIDCSIYPQQTVTLTYNLNPPVGYVLKNQGTPAPGVYTGDVQANPASFTVTNDLKKGVVVTASVSGAADSASLTFAGWNTQPDGKGQSYAPGSTITTTESLTLYAQWTGGDFNTGTLEVEKKVTVAAGSEQPAADSFTFKITLSGSYPFTVYNSVTGAQISSGTMTDGTFTLKDGQFIRFTGVPVASYTITETLPTNYTNANSTQTISLKGGYTNTVVFDNIYSKIIIGIENGYDGKLYPETPDGLENVTYRWYRDTASYSYSTTNWLNQWTVVDSQYIDQNGAVDVINHEGYVHENSNTVSGTKYRYKLEVLDVNGNVIADDIFVVNFGDRILNSSFESPQTGGWLGLPNGYENLFWASTDEHESDYEVEIVASGHEGFGGKKTTNGNQFAEINAEMSTSLYQDVVTTPGNGLTWTLGHSARVEEGTDEMFVIITSSQSAVTIIGQSQVKAMIEAAKAADALDGETDVTYGDITFRIWRLESAFVDADTWTQYAGHYTVPAGQRMTRFFFAAGKTANGVESYGNLIDGVKFSETIYYVVNYYLDGELVPGASVSGSGAPAEVIAPDLDAFAKAYNAVLNADSDKTMVLSSDKANVLNLYYRSKYSVTGEINNNGKVTNAAQTVLRGDNAAQMVFTPATGYKITGITVNGTAVQVTNENSFSYTAANVTENVRVVVTTAIKTFSVTGSIDNDGIVTNPNQTVNYGDANAAMTFTPKSGYKIVGVTVNGVAVTGFSESSYTFLETITEDTVVVVTTAQNIFTVIWQDWDGSELGRGDWVYGTTPSFDADPDKAGNQDPTRASDAQFSYTFTGWTPAVSPVTGDATYKATYKATTRSYEVTWVDGDGKELYSETVQYGLTPVYTGATPTKTATAQYTYVFNGSWSPAISKVTGDVTYVAQFDPVVNSYTITWVDGDGKVLKTEELKYGDTPVYSGAEPTKKATAEFTYTFNNKWSPAIVDVTGNATYTAQFSSEVNTYTITWVDGNGDVLKTEDLAYGVVPAYTGATPTKDPTAEFVYTFNNTWSPAIVKVSEDATYTAQFRSETRTYTVTWWIDLNDDGVMDNDEILEKDTGVPFGAKPSYDQAGDPQKAPDAEWYYIFAGWSPDHNYATVEKDLTFEAMFNPVKQEYPIYWYNFDNATLLHKDDAVEYGTLPVYDGPTPTWEPGDGYAYEFSHWSPAISKVTGAASYYAIYDKTPIEYTITYVLNDGTVIGTATNPGTYTVVSDPITLNPPVPDKPYYRFVGWTGTGLAAMTEDVTIPTGSMGNRTYTAHYELIEYTIHFDPNGGTPASIADKTYKYGDNVTLPTVTKAGYTGVWKVVSDSGNWIEGEPVVSGTMNKYGDVTLSVVWTPTTYTIRFHGNAANATGSMADMSVVYDTTAYLTANAFSRLGYSFAGWALTANGAVAYADQAQISNLTADGGVVDLYAVWTMNLVSLTIRTQNTVDTNQSYIYTVIGTAVDGTHVELTVAMGANDVQRIVDLPAGKYTISDQQGWSWRYAHQSQEEDVYTNILVEFTYVYQEMMAARIYWLNGYGNEQIRTKSEDND